MIDYSKLQNGSDVRGVALPLVAAEPVTLTEEAAGQIARAYAAWLAEHCGKPMPAAGGADRTGSHGCHRRRLRDGQHPGHVYGNGAAGL